MAYNSSHTGPEIDAAVGAVQEKEAAWDGKQDKVTGLQGQVVGFDQDGDMVAENKYPDGGTAGQILTKTADGEEWADVPKELPTGGTQGQVLTQGASGPEWADAPDPLPDGGTEGQLLTKTADGTAWQDKPAYTADEVGARPSTWTPSSADVGAIPATEKGTSSGVATLDSTGKLTEAQKPAYTAGEVGARPSTWTPSASDVGAMPAVSGGTTGQVLTKTADGQAWQNPPASGMTQTEADARYLQLSGGTMTGDIEFPGGGNISRNYIESANDITIEQPRTGGGTGYTRVMVSETMIQLLMDHGSGVERFVFTPSGLNMGNKPITNCPSITTSTDQTVTLSSGSWTSSGGVYQQTVNVTGVTADTPVIIVNPSLSTTDADANDTILEAWGKIAKLEISQGAGTLTFRATEALRVNVPVKVGVC